MRSPYFSFQKIGKALVVIAIATTLLSVPMFRSNSQAAPDLAKAKDFPAVTALGFAVSALTVYKYVSEADLEAAYQRDIDSNRWNPFDNL